MPSLVIFVSQDRPLEKPHQSAIPVLEQKFSERCVTMLRERPVHPDSLVAAGCHPELGIVAVISQHVTWRLWWRQRRQGTGKEQRKGLRFPQLASRAMKQDVGAASLRSSDTANCWRFNCRQLSHCAKPR